MTGKGELWHTKEEEEGSCLSMGVGDWIGFW